MDIKKLYDAANNTLTDKFGNKKLHAATAVSSLATVGLFCFNVVKTTPAGKIAGNIAVGITTAIAAADLVTRTNNFVHDDIKSDPSKGEGALDGVMNQVFATSSKVVNV